MQRETAYKMLDPPVLAQLLRDAKEENFVVIDVREEDVTGGSIPTSLNIPAANFERHIPELIQKYAQYDYVIFHCMHSQVRGPSCATEFSRALRWAPEKKQSQNVFVLQGGFAGWARRYGEEKDLVQDMSKRMWTQTFSEMSPLMKMALTEPFDEDDEDDEEDFALYSGRKGT